MCGCPKTYAEISVLNSKLTGQDPKQPNLTADWALILKGKQTILHQEVSSSLNCSIMAFFFLLYVLLYSVVSWFSLYFFEFKLFETVFLLLTFSTFTYFICKCI